MKKVEQQNIIRSELPKSVYTELLSNPNVQELYNRCLSSEFHDRTTYLQNLLAFVHACDLANMDENANHEWETVKNVSLCLIDIHLSNQYHAYCHSELDFLLQHYMEQEGSALPEDVEKILTKVHTQVNGNFADYYEECPVSAKILTQ